MASDQALRIELKHAVNCGAKQAVGRAETVVGLPVRLVGFSVSVHAAVRQLPVAQCPCFGGVAQQAPHAHNLFVPAQ